MLDKLHQPISIGDYVVCARQHTVSFYIDRVKSFTPKMVKLESGKIKNPNDILVITLQYRHALATYPEHFI